MNRAIEWIIEALMSWCIKRGRVLNITGTAGPDDVYLIRYILLRTRFLSVYIHQFLRSDRDDLHDHPWHFATFLVRGAYTENKYNFKTMQVEKIRREAWPFRSLNRLVFRRATDQHQVVVDRDLKPSQKADAALTFFVGGPAFREWGFIKEVETVCVGKHCLKERRWVDWRKYLGLPPDHPSR